MALGSILFDIYFLINSISVTFKLPSNVTDVARAGRAGKAGTRVGRLLKIARMIRVFRVAKLYKETKKAIDERRKVLKLKNKNSSKKIVPSKTKEVVLKIDPKRLK